MLITWSNIGQVYKNRIKAPLSNPQVVYSQSLVKVLDLIAIIACSTELLLQVLAKLYFSRDRSLNIAKGYCNGLQAFRAYFPEFIGNVKSTLSVNYPDIR